MRFSRVLAFALSACVLGLFSQRLSCADAADGTMHVRAFDLPLSRLLSADTHAVLKREIEEIEKLRKTCPVGEQFKDATHSRPCFLPYITRMRARCAVSIQPATLGGVPVEIIAPEEGVSAAHREQVLINLHGGASRSGARWMRQIESIPIAAVGKYKAVSVDYRPAPEYQFPEANEGVETVYRELLKTYGPQHIGIYGCPAGGVLTAQVTAWLQWKKLSTPGAIAMMGAAATFWADGDSGRFAEAQRDTPRMDLYPRENPYLKDIDSADPLTWPARSDEVLGRFPPSLLITSTRDIALSSVANTHSRRVALGVEAELHVWEGLGHQFFADPDLPESREVYDVVARFFDRHLGQPEKARSVVPDATLEETLEAEVEQFVKTDAASPPVPGQVLFVGSSSVVQWQSLAQDMAPLPVINRGFGGSQIEFVNRWFDQVVAPYRPRAIVFYAGENDIASGKPVERVVADFGDFMAKKTAALGQTPVYFISIKPSKLRWRQFKLQSEANEAIRARAAQRSDLRYIDVASLMLENGKPKDLFLPDDLHMTPKGYVIWARAVRAALLSHAAPAAFMTPKVHGGDASSQNSHLW